MHILVSI